MVKQLKIAGRGVNGERSTAALKATRTQFLSTVPRTQTIYRMLNIWLTVGLGFRGRDVQRSAG